MSLTETDITWLFGCLLLIGLLVAYPAVTTAIGLLRSQRVFGRLYWHVVTHVDRHREL